MYTFLWNPFIIISHHLHHPFLAAYTYISLHSELLSVRRSSEQSLKPASMRKQETIFQRPYKLKNNVRQVWKASRTAGYCSANYQCAQIIDVACKLVKAIKEIASCTAAGLDLTWELPWKVLSALSSRYLLMQAEGTRKNLSYFESSLLIASRKSLIIIICFIVCHSTLMKNEYTCCNSSILQTLSSTKSVPSTLKIYYFS